MKEEMNKERKEGRKERMKAEEVEKRRIVRAVKI